MTIKEQLEEKLKTKIESISEKGGLVSKEDKDELTWLYGLYNQETKLEIDAEDKKAQRAIEHNRETFEEAYKEEQMKNDLEREEKEELRKDVEIKEQRKDRVVRIVIAGAEIFVPIVTYICLFYAGLRFEVNGTPTSKFFMNLINKLPWKKGK